MKASIISTNRESKANRKILSSILPPSSTTISIAKQSSNVIVTQRSAWKHLSSSAAFPITPAAFTNKNWQQLTNDSTAGHTPYIIHSRTSLSTTKKKTKKCPESWMAQPPGPHMNHLRTLYDYIGSVRPQSFQKLLYIIRNPGRDGSSTLMSDACIYHSQPRMRENGEAEKGEMRWTANIDNAYRPKDRNEFVKTTISCQVVHYKTLIIPAGTYHRNWTDSIGEKLKFLRLANRR